MQSSHTLFHTTATNHSTAVNKLPVLTTQQREQLFAGATISPRLGYLFDPNRSARHYHAQVLAQALYHTGATLINQNLAYSEHAMQLLRAESINDELHSDTQLTVDLCLSLMDKYHALPKFEIRNGSHPANNPLQALLPIKVALDHLPAAMIYNWYKELKRQAAEMTIFPHPITFPDNSQFLGDHATWQFLQMYIISNMPNKFSSILPPKTQQNLLHLLDPFETSYFDLVGNKSKQDIKPTIRELMGQHFNEIAPTVSCRAPSKN